MVRTECGLTCEIALVNPTQIETVQLFIDEEKSQRERERKDLIAIYTQRDQLEEHQWILVQGIVQRLMAGQSTHLDIIRNGHKVPYSFARWIRTPESSSNMDPSAEMPMTAEEQDAQDNQRA
jgi:Na+-translocating ferredoxin:NAD+ oxidoreductase RnfC subunit